MSRWPPDAAGRLKSAALSLFSERGFAAVTGAEIAARAGVSERTFFRHFKAKEDVLFEDYSGLGEAMASAIASAPEGASARDVMQRLADLLSESFAPHRGDHRFLRDVIAREPALRAKELLRDHAWAAAIAEGFARRGYSPTRAALLASATASTLRVAHDAWLSDDAETTLARRFAEAIEALSGDLA